VTLCTKKKRRGDLQNEEEEEEKERKEKMRHWICLLCLCV
jgi:hypothetical protein